MIWSQERSDRGGPAEWVWGPALLYGRQGIVELLGDRTDLTIAIGRHITTVLD